MAFNKVILMGNIAQDIELKQTQSGISVCSFSLAVNRKGKQGEEAVTDFITIQAWRQTAEFVAKYFSKGKPILVCGELQTRSWTDQQGNKRYATEVVANEVSFCGAKADGEGNNAPTKERASNGQKNGSQGYMPTAYTDAAPLTNDTDEDLPF